MRRTALVRRQGATRKPCRAPSFMMSIMTARASPRMESSSRSWALQVSSQICTLLRLVRIPMILATRVQQVDPPSRAQVGPESVVTVGPLQVITPSPASCQVERARRCRPGRLGAARRGVELSVLAVGGRALADACERHPAGLWWYVDEEATPTGTKTTRTETTRPASLVDDLPGEEVSKTMRVFMTEPVGRVVRGRRTSAVALSGPGGAAL